MAHDRDRLWPVLAAHRDTCACLDEWRLRCAVHFATLRSLLTHPAGCLADTYPCPHTGLPLEIRSGPDGTFYAVHEDRTMGDAPPLRLAPAKAAAWRIDWPRFDSALCAAFDASPITEDAGLGSAHARLIGRIDGVRRLFVLVTSDARELHAWATRLRSETQPCTVLAMRADASAEDLLVAKGHAFIALDCYATLSVRGASFRLTLRTPPASPPASRIAVPPLSAQWAAEGERFAISPSFDSLHDRRDGTEHPIVNPNIAAALEALARHALGQGNAKSRDFLLPEIHAIRKSKGLRDAPTYDMAHFFGEKDGPRRATWPFYREIVRNARRHGLYWLEL